MVKPGSNGKVTATRVYQFKPLFQAIQQKIIHVLNEDENVLTENLPVEMAAHGLSKIAEDDPRKEQVKQIVEKLKNNNGQMLINYFDNLENEKKFALYRWDHQENSSTEVQKATLGRRISSTKDLDQLYQFEHLRNYSYS